MKFTDGYWRKLPGLEVHHPREIQSIVAIPDGFRAYAPTRHLNFTGAELDLVMLTVSVRGVSEGIIKVTLEYHQGDKEQNPNFNYIPNKAKTDVTIGECNAELKIGSLSARIQGKDTYKLSFLHDGEEITSAIVKSTGIVFAPDEKRYIHEQLTLQPGETIYGLGERFGAFVKNGQKVEMWNEDGGTASELAYKNIPFYLSSAGYGVIVNHPEKVSYEIASEVNSRVQFSVPGNKLEYFIIAGPTPKEALSRYTHFVGLPPRVPQWSYGLWMSTSFKTDYSETSVNQLLDEFEENDIPVSVLHFDCYWMRPSHWCDFIWDPEKFPDPARMLERLHQRGIKVCVWINPYIAQQSYLFAEGKEKGYLLKDLHGNVRQWDHWQSGMAWVDFTNPQACDWWKSKLRDLLKQGVDAFKTDFGERVPTDVVWHDGSDPEKMHNYYAKLYNQNVYEVIAEEKSEEEALVFARSATLGSQSYPVHWGGDSEPTFVSMAETLRGGLSLAMSGFGYWSHDMGGFEGRPDSDVFTRWYPFGMFSSHSRLHGSDSYRTPWLYGETATKVARRFTHLKNRLLPYILNTQQQVVENGIPFMRPMLLEYPEDMGSRYVDTQYFFGDKILVAPVFSRKGEVHVYLPVGGWTNILDGQRIPQAGWVKQIHSEESLPLLVKDGSVIPLGKTSRTINYDPTDNPILLVVGASQSEDQQYSVSIAGEEKVSFDIELDSGSVSIKNRGEKVPFRVLIMDKQPILRISQGSVIDETWVPELGAAVAVLPDKDAQKIEIYFDRLSSL
ncbi:alpha-D-xyloside xylohydrolase [Arcanobacterium phocae]|uniref:alpha-D-xyloside xylohydrolase n=1 Tax=Arcanobacterium phocae TaxID=131112 RepID=A0A1H2LF81_9ACTO|nr:alpha-xylosidase [Arcanobacterium phocae]SDU79569.1 alpha-D-xyloside xylohydrolase [Arcanobacterium phocae]